MGTRINSSVDALTAQRNLSSSAARYARSVQRLSSGLRINSAADDAAGLAISQKLAAQSTGLDQATRNAQDGISLVQTAEGALNATHALLQRARELGLQAANDTLNSTDRDAIDQELQQIDQQITGIGDQTEFNGQQLLAGNGAGPAHNASLNLSVSSGAPMFGVTGTTTQNGTFHVQVTSTSPLEAALDQGSGYGPSAPVTGLGAVALGTTGLNLYVPFASNVGDTYTVVASGGRPAGAPGPATFLLQIGANAGETMTVSINDMRATAIGAGAYTSLDAAIADYANARAGSSSTSATIEDWARNLVGCVDQAISDVSSTRGSLGAYQNRLEHTVANLGVEQENTTAARSRIVDADVAAETVTLASSGILQQAGQAVLAQVNQASSSILSLLRS